jgi:hypothetical protein
LMLLPEGHSFPWRLGKLRSWSRKW